MVVPPDVAKPIHDKYHNNLNPLLDRSGEIPRLLAHYTSVQAAEQIIKNEQFWMSHPFYMNDMEELRYGMWTGIQRFPAYVQRLDFPTARAQLLHANFIAYVDHMRQTTLENTYVLCFSEHPDGDTDGLLSMWRSYASQGHGVAMVFNTRRLPDPPQAPLWYAKVLYMSPDDRSALLDHALQRWVEITTEAKLTDDQLYLAAFAAFHFIRNFALVTKHQGFAEEREWRIIYLPDLDLDGRLAPQFSYHVTARGAEPKLKFKVAPVGNDAPPEALSLANMLEFILLGPSHSSPLAQAAFRRLLRGTSLEAFQDRVLASSIPLRPTFG